MHVVIRARMRPELSSRSLIKRRFLRSLFLFLEILSLSESSRMPLAALQITFSILFHLVLHPRGFYLYAYLSLDHDSDQSRRY